MPARTDEEPSSAVEADEPQATGSLTEGETGLQAAETKAEPAPPEAAQEVERLGAELEGLRDLLRRKQAEFENYRKRVERERQDFVEHAASDLVKQLLSVLDNLKRALAAAETSDGARLREGVEMIHRQFEGLLQKAGLRQVEDLGCDFDPNVHEAVARVVTTDVREGQVIEVHQKGYFLKDRLLRPALVSVAQSPKMSPDMDEASSDEASQSDSDETES